MSTCRDLLSAPNCGEGAMELQRNNMIYSQPRVLWIQPALSLYPVRVLYYTSKKVHRVDIIKLAITRT